MRSSQDPDLSWDDLAWIRSCAPGLPLVVKGIQTAEVSPRGELHIIASGCSSADVC